MLDNLTRRFSQIIKNIRGEARLTEANMQDMLREVRVALLEADVALPVVKIFVNNIKEKAQGQKIIGSLSPGQALVGIVHKELISLMGEENLDLNLTSTLPVVILMTGLQGSGKTTTTAKLAKRLKEQKKKCLVVSCDVYRPAAIEQLRAIADQIGVDSFLTDPTYSPQVIGKQALEYAKRHYYDVLFVDTAGRLAIDEIMMNEIKNLHSLLNPIETLYVVDAMQGQDAVNTAKAFNEALPLTGIVLTKLDGDTRGGAALSVHHVTGKPIKFIGISEKLDGLELFYPERMASRILGMGDILTLVEEAHRNVDQKVINDFALKVKTGKGFDLNDFKVQIEQMRKMGGLNSLLDKLPAQISQVVQVGQVNDRALPRIEGIIKSMTPQERRKPEIIKASRKRRIAAGAGVSVQEVNRLLDQFEQTQKMMKQLSKGGMAKMVKAIRSNLL